MRIGEIGWLGHITYTVHKVQKKVGFPGSVQEMPAVS